MRASYRLDVNIGLAVRALFGGRRGGFLMFAEGHELIDSFHKHKDNESHNKEIDNSGKELAVLYVLTRAEKLKMARDLSAADRIDDRIDKAFGERCHYVLKKRHR